MSLLRDAHIPLAAFVLLAAGGLALACAGSEETNDDDDGPSTSSTGGAGAQGGAGGGTGAQGGGGTGGGTGGQGGGTGGQGGQGGMPMSMCADPNAVVFAVSKLYLGDTDENDVSSPTAWKQFGHDLDGLVTTNDFTGHCTPNSGGNQNSQVDGDNGIDNAFGRNVLPIITALDSTFSQTVNANLLAGEYTLLLKLAGLGVAADQDPVPTKFYAGAPLGMAPKFDGTDCWQVQQELLNDPADLESAKIVFPDATLASDLFSSGVASQLTIVISVVGFSVTLELQSARLTMQLDPDHGGATVGRLGGVIETEKLVDEFKKAAGSFDPSLCMGATIDSIANQVRQASDIMQDGTQNPNATCDGISIGLGFRMEAAGIAGIAPPQPPPVDPCAP